MIDAGGLVVAPGFIDLDSLAHLARFSVQDGVTTALDIQAAHGCVSRWYEQNQKVLINLGVGVGYSLVREDVMGQTGRFDRRETVARLSIGACGDSQEAGGGLDEGAVGVGMGPSFRWSPPIMKEPDWIVLPIETPPSPLTTATAMSGKGSPTTAARYWRCTARDRGHKSRSPWRCESHAADRGGRPPRRVPAAHRLLGHEGGSCRVARREDRRLRGLRRRAAPDSDPPARRWRAAASDAWTTAITSTPDGPLIRAH